MDFTDLNKACPKDHFLVPQIDQLVDATVEHPQMSFLDDFQGYHQIPLALSDQEKTAFLTPTRNYHYCVMPFKHLNDLGSVFLVLRKHKLHLNASKCFFGVNSGKCLGYMITHQGIEVNLDQIKAINDLHPPQNPKKAQKLTRMIAILNRFISQSVNRCQPFFQLLYIWKSFEWIEECIVAFKELEQ